MIACLYDVLRDDVGEIARESRFHPIGLRLHGVEIAYPSAVIRLVYRIGSVEAVIASFPMGRVGRREYRDIGTVDRLQCLPERQGNDLGVSHQLPDRHRHGESPPRSVYERSTSQAGAATQSIVLLPDFAVRVWYRPIE